MVPRTQQNYLKLIFLPLHMSFFVLSFSNNYEQ